LAQTKVVPVPFCLYNLYGGPGMDWYFAGLMYMLFNKTPGKVVTPI
jgi:hypothetical protein